MKVTFSETLLNAVDGRNGFFHSAGLEVSGRSRLVAITPLSSKGEPLRAGMSFLGADCGAIARAIAEAGAKADPEAREAIAAQLRAALVTLGTGTDESLDDTVSTFGRGWG
jgi:hypothetical protein